MCEDEPLDREIEKEEIVKCICELQNNKTGSSNRLVWLLGNGLLVGAFI